MKDRTLILVSHTSVRPGQFSSVLTWIPMKWNQAQRICGWSDVYLHCYLFPRAKSVSPLPLLSTEGAQAVFPGVHRSLPGGWDAVQHPSQSQAIGIQEGNSIIIIRYIRCISVCGVKLWNKLKGALRPLSRHERVRTAVQTCGYHQVWGKKKVG